MAITLPDIGQLDWGDELNLALTTLDAEATAAQATATAAEAAANAAAADADAAAGDAATAAASAAAASAAVASKIGTPVTRTAAGATVLRVNLNYAVNTADPNIIEVANNGTLIAWQNEVGLFRARVADNEKWDTCYRAIQVAGQTGTPFAYQNTARTTDLWAVNPDDGATMRSGVKMSDVLVLGAADPIPANTPAGTVIMRTA